MKASEPTGCEELVLDFINTPSAAEAGEILSHLAITHLCPLVEGVARARLARFPRFHQEAGDIAAEALVKILSRLQGWRAGSAEPIGDLLAYAAIATRRACDQLFREHFPNRHRLKNRIRYVLKPERGYAVWTAPNHEICCGLSPWEGRRAAQPVELGVSAILPLHEMICAFFGIVGQPVELDHLVDLIAAATGVSDLPGDLEKLIIQSSSPALPPAADSGCDWATWASRLWAEVLQLPLTQRTALMLNLRWCGEGCPLDLFLLSGVASFDQIAMALDLTAEALAELWNRLPIPDQEIAERLGLSRQQIINLRLSARRRLEKRFGEAISHMKAHLR